VEPLRPFLSSLFYNPLTRARPPRPIHQCRRHSKGSAADVGSLGWPLIRPGCIIRRRARVIVTVWARIQGRGVTWALAIARRDPQDPPSDHPSWSATSVGLRRRYVFSWDPYSSPLRKFGVCTKDSPTGLPRLLTVGFTTPPVGVARAGLGTMTVRCRIQRAAQIKYL
jgi:hypothetical protein